MDEDDEDDDEDDEEEDEEDNEDGYAHPDLLMKALRREDAPLRVYGWVEGGIQFNPAHPRDGENLPNTTTNQANQWQFRQVYVVVEKALKRADSFDLGFRFDNLFGTDWQLFHAEGLANHTLRTGGYGYSPSQAYVDMHLPILTEGGVDVRLGRFISLAGYESALAPGRPLMSTGYLYNYSHPFSHIGALFTWNVTDRFQLYNAPVNGWDRWLDAKNQWGYMGGFSWDTRDERTNLTMTVHAGPNQISQSASGGILPVFTQDARPDASRLSDRFRRSQQTLLLAGVLTHEWTDRLTSVVEADYGQELNVPILANDEETKNSIWYGTGAWLLYDFTDTLTGVARTTYFRDVNGLRTGYNDSYIEATLGLIWRPRDWFWIRPEVRYDGSWGAPPFDDGNARRQLTFGFDAIFLF